MIIGTWRSYFIGWQIFENKIWCPACKKEEGTFTFTFSCISYWQAELGIVQCCNIVPSLVSIIGKVWESGLYFAPQPPCGLDHFFGVGPPPLLSAGRGGKPPLPAGQGAHPWFPALFVGDDWGKLMPLFEILFPRFVNLLSQLEIEQAEIGGALSRSLKLLHPHLQQVWHLNILLYLL